MRGTITIDPNWVPPGAEAGPPGTPEGTPAAGTPEASPVATPESSPVATPEASPAATPAAAAPQEVTLEADDIGWKVGDQPGPTVAFSIATGGTITFVNTGAAPHNFTVEALGISVDPLPGETLTVPIPPGTQPGDYEFYFAVPGHADGGMSGTLTVQ
jgi:plastocyanin